MPTILRQDGFDVVIYTNDHEPPHVHVFYGGEKLVIDLNTLQSRIHPAMKLALAKRAKKIVADHRQLLLDKWNEIHGGEK